MKKKSLFRWVPNGILCLVVFFIIFVYLGSQMGTANMLNTIMKTSHDLLLNTVFYLMAICVITGAIGKVFVEFGVVRLLEKLLRPLMKPLFNLPGVASLGAVLTFLSDNPAIISLAQDKRFATYFKKYQFISLTNFGTAFGMGLLVIVFMVGQGYFVEPIIGLFGAFVGCVISTRLMQRFVIKAYPKYKEEVAAAVEETTEEGDDAYEKPLFQRILDSLLDGGRTGVDVGLAIIPGVLIISTLVMMFTFGPSQSGDFTGAAYEGVQLLPWVGEKLGFIFEWLFGFTDPHLIAFPITALGAVGAALGLIPNFAAEGWVNGNAIAVFTAIGMCWSGYLSTHTAMLDTIGYRSLTSKAILAHTIGGFVAGIVAHWVYVLVSLLFFSPAPVERIVELSDEAPVVVEWNGNDSLWSVVETGAEGEEPAAMYEFKVDVPEKGNLTVAVCNAEGKGAINVYGVALADDSGNTTCSDYSRGVTNEGTGALYLLEDISSGVYSFRCYAEGGERLRSTGGNFTLAFASERSVEAHRLGELVRDVKARVKNAVAEPYVNVLNQLCGKCEELRGNSEASLEQLEAAYDELRKAYDAYVKETDMEPVPLAE